MVKRMNLDSKQFLTIGGVVLIVVGLLGMIGVLGPTADQSIFGDPWWFDAGENWAHLVLGIVALVAVYALPAKHQKPLVFVLGVVGVLVGLYSLFISTDFLGSMLQNPADTLLHLVVGAWALASASMDKKSM